MQLRVGVESVVGSIVYVKTYVAGPPEKAFGTSSLRETELIILGKRQA